MDDDKLFEQWTSEEQAVRARLRPAGRGYSTLELKINLVRALKAGSSTSGARPP
jgi:acyl-coenzyme A thioesterase PaaI-like protein